MFHFTDNIMQITISVEQSLWEATSFPSCEETLRKFGRSIFFTLFKRRNNPDQFSLRPPILYI